MTTIRENAARVSALKKVPGTQWTGNTIHDTIDKCLRAINFETLNGGLYNPKGVRIGGVPGIYLVNKDGSIFCEARIIKEGTDKYRIEYMSNAAWREFEKNHSEFLEMTQPKKRTGINKKWFKNRLRNGEFLVRCKGKFSDDYAFDNSVNFSREDGFKPCHPLRFDDSYLNAMYLYGDKDGIINGSFASCEYWEFKLTDTEREKILFKTSRDAEPVEASLIHSINGEYFFVRIKEGEWFKVYEYGSAKQISKARTAKEATEKAAERLSVWYQGVSLYSEFRGVHDQINRISK